MDAKIENFINEFVKVAEKSKDLPIEQCRVLSTNFFTKDVKLPEGLGTIINTHCIGIDDNKIPLRIYLPKSSISLPVLLYMHGGGFVFGSIEESDLLCHKLAINGKCIVVSVGYRLAPENQFPKPLNDCYSALQWVSENIGLYSGNPNRISVAGDSAGGNLAAALCLMTRDMNGPKINMQILIYPAISADLNKKAFERCLDQKFLTYDSMQFFWKMYLAQPTDAVNPYASPEKADLRILPRTFILIAEFDPLCTDGEKYAAKLLEAGNEVRFKRYRGVIHGFLQPPIQDTDQAKQAIEDIAFELEFHT